MSYSLRAIICFVAVAAACGPAAAANREATPGTLASVLQAAAPGDNIRLAPGAYDELELKGVSFDRPVVIDASGATLTGLKVDGVKGLTFKGGEYRLGPPRDNPTTGKPVYGAALRIENSEQIDVENAHFAGPGIVKGGPDDPYGEGYGLWINSTTGVKVASNQFTGFRTGLVLGLTHEFEIRDNSFAGMRSDGMDIARSQKGVVEGNHCGDTRIRDKEHPDCIQLWSRPTAPPTGDIVIRKNHAEGPTQGIFAGNRVRDGVDDGGFDRITIEQNDMYVTFPNAVALSPSARDSVVRNNTVRTYPGARFWARVVTGPNTVRCGNVVGPGAGKAGVTDPPCRN